jgi:hypothetical protein
VVVGRELQLEFVLSPDEELVSAILLFILQNEPPELRVVTDGSVELGQVEAVALPAGKPNDSAACGVGHL